jgi:hypothetical protein
MPYGPYTYTFINPPPGPSDGGFRSVNLTQVNDLGQVLGVVNTVYSRGLSISEWFLYENGTYTVLDVPGAFSTTATQLNDAGQVLGRYQGSGVTGAKPRAPDEVRPAGRGTG